MNWLDELVRWAHRMSWSYEPVWWACQMSWSDELFIWAGQMSWSDELVGWTCWMNGGQRRTVVISVLAQTHVTFEGQVAVGHMTMCFLFWVFYHVLTSLHSAQPKPINVIPLWSFSLCHSFCCQLHKSLHFSQCVLCNQFLCLDNHYLHQFFSYHVKYLFVVYCSPPPLYPHNIQMDIHHPIDQAGFMCAFDNSATVNRKQRPISGVLYQ